ncbi:MAG: GNAT family N-acetyltransferase [Planctomyces sp.]|nr:GNAT family N-acetyltransferase [Planctomyces sp.]
MTEVSIRPLPASEYSKAAEWLADPHLNKFLASEWRNQKVSERTLAVVAMNPKNRLFLVTCDGIGCGIVALGGIDTLDQTATLWYVLGDQAFGGRGVITRAVELLLSTVFGELNLKSVNASVASGHIVSIRILEKNGFVYAGKLRRNMAVEGDLVDRLLFDRLP